MTDNHLPSTKIRYPPGSGFSKNFDRPQWDMHILESHAGGVAMLSSYATYSRSNHIDEGEGYYQESTLVYGLCRETTMNTAFAIRTVLL